MPFRKSSRTNRESTKVPFIAGFVLAVALLCGLSAVGISKVSAVDTGKDCDGNALIYCGYTSSSDFVSKVRSNNSGNGHRDLQAIYAHFGLEPQDYDRFVTSALHGVAYADGRIVVDDGNLGNITVATNAKSIGRDESYQGSNPFSMNIDGTTYWGNTNDQAFGPTARAEGLPVTVLFNSQGQMQFAVLDSCGNTEFGTNSSPSYSCQELQKSQVALNTYRFTTNAPVSGNARIARVVYNFGDGATATEPSPGTPVTHKYAKPGTYKATVTVYVYLPGNQTVAVQSSNCQTTIVIPFYECVQLSGTMPTDDSEMVRTFVATANYSAGVTFGSADFYFGDGHSALGIKPTAGSKQVSYTYTYAKAGTYNASATLHFMVNGFPVSAATCAAVVTPTTPPTPECKPGVPEGSAACSPCPTDTSVPIGSPQCISTPPVLPNTGAGDTIGIFAAVVVASFLVYRQVIFRKHRAAFLAAERGTSPPLSDPLNEGEQLHVAPAAHKRRSFRRKRLY